MTRISDASSINGLINSMLRTEQRREDANFQVVSGKISPDYAGISRQSGRLVNLETTRDLTNRFISNNETAQLRTDVTVQSLEFTQDAIKDMRETISNFLGRGSFDQLDVEELQKFAFNSLLNMEAFLNIDVDGQFLFAGSRTDQRPVDLGLTSLDAFQQKYDGATNQYATTRDAHMIQLSNNEDTNNLNMDYIDASNWLVFRQDDDGSATTTGTSSIEATSAMFTDYEPGSRISVTGTASNNGEYTVKSVSTDGTKIFVSTEMFTNEELPLGLVSETTTGVAQVDTLTLGGTFEAGDVFNVNVGGTTVSYTAVGGDTNIDGIRSSLRAAINADPTVSALVTASDGGAGQLVLTADSPGVAFSTTAYATNGGATDDSTITVATTTANAGNVTFTLPDASQLTNANTGNVTFDRDAGTIAATTADSFTTVNVGDVINVSGDNGSNGSYTVTAIDASSQTLTVTAGATITLGDGTVVDANDTARMIFDRAGDTITSDRAAFTAFRAGDKITVAGTAKNDGVYTVSTVAADGKSISVNSTKLTDEGSGSGTKFFDYNVGTRFQFNTTAETIAAQDISGNVIAGAFNGLQVGDSIAVTGSTDNDATYTIGSISTDGSTITMAGSTPLIGTDETDSNGVGLAASARGFELRSGNEIVFNDTANTISLRDITSNAATQNIFDNLAVGVEFTITGTASNDGTYTVSSISSDGSSITVAEDITIAETFDPSVALTQVNVQVFAANGTVASSQSYYNGDEFTMTHRVDENRTINWDINAGHPAFEKAIRAMSILAQGEFGTEGGLDQNTDRIRDALYLLNDSLESPADGTPPYGDELDDDLQEIIFGLGFKQVVLNDTINNQTAFNNLLDGFISETEDADQLEAITRLMDEQRSLEASYQALSRVFQMNLADFL